MRLLAFAAALLAPAAALAAPCPKCGYDLSVTVPIVVQPQPQAQPQAQPSCPSAEQPAPRPADDGARQRIRDWMAKLMDETREVPGHNRRGSPGSYAKLSKEQVEEFVSGIIDGAAMFGPASLSREEREALVAVEISIESAFQVSTSGVNPGDQSKRSVGPLQLTLPGMWDDILRQYCKAPLKHYDGSAWDVPKTDNSALEHSVYDNLLAALWCITEQGRRGCPDWFGGPDGPAPKTYRTAFLGWVLGCPKVKDGGDLAGQRAPYISSIESDLKLLGFPVSLIDAPF